MSMLQASGLGGGYGPKAVLADIDIALDAGECVALLGPNGAGKSTLLRLLAGILPAQRGEVRLDGRPLGAWRRRDVARVLGYVPQLVSFAFPLTVCEVVEQGRAPHLGPWRPPAPADRAAVDTAIARVGLADRVRIPIQHLSGGERQLVVLARALAGEPRLLLLDEPANALDVRHQIELVGILTELVRSGVGVLLVAHDWNLAMRLAHRVVVLDRGRVAATGPPTEVLRPEVLRRIFGVETELLRCDDGASVIVARAPAQQ